MADDELNPLSQRLARWVDNDSIPDAISALRQEIFQSLQKEYPKGIPEEVMVRLLMAGQAYQIEFLRDMVIDALSAAKDWDEDETRRQQAYAVLILEFVREEGKWLTLEMMELPKQGE